MKFLCEHCGQLDEAASVRVDEDRISLSCSRCGKESPLLGEGKAPPASNASATPPTGGVVDSGSPLPPDGSAVSPDDESPDRETARPGSGAENVPIGEPPASAAPPHSTVHCPKCFHRQEGDGFCHRCGLDLDRAARDHLDFEPVYPGQTEVVEQALGMWSEAMAGPDHQELHERFLNHCWEHGLMELAMRRYRQRLAESRDDKRVQEFAAKAALRMERASLVMLESERWAPDLVRRTRIIKGILLVIAAILLICGLVFVILAYQHQRTGIPPAL